MELTDICWEWELVDCGVQVDDVWRGILAVQVSSEPLWKSKHISAGREGISVQFLDF